MSDRSRDNHRSLKTLQRDQSTNTPFHAFEDIRGIEDLEIVSEAVIWQNFERLAAFIFEKNDFEVSVNTVKTWNKKRRQYDVISWKSNQTFLVECKKWAGSRYRLSALKKAIEQHKERTVFYENIMNEDAIPLVVTLVEEEIHWYEGVPIVPILKLNSFISELDTGAAGYSFYDYEDTLPYPDDVPPDSFEYSGVDDEGL
jgi:Restriction endonuclease